MQELNELKKVIESYLEPEQVSKIRRAIDFGSKAHEGQMRQSGEPYISHPIAVATILGEMHMDHQTIQAAILHDTIEDTETAKSDIKRRFGKGVAELVDGVSKLTMIDFDSVEEKQAHNFRKMIMAMSNDIRVILVKLADRLHNMRTLGALPAAKRRRIARETLEIYAPIAQRLGINSIRLELEELGFQTLYPMRHRILTEQVINARGHRKEIIAKIRNALRRRLRQEKIPTQIQGREKHLYGIYEKMREQKLSFNEVYDVYAFRLLVDNVDTCYRALGVVHNLYRPVPGRFKDYIAIPKNNGYQSLHTILFGPYGVNIEVQIRTHAMHDVAESGIAAHWLYKTGSHLDRKGAHKRAREWLRSIIEMHQTAGDPQEFLENVKIDLFPESVYVFTPKGKIIELPKGATPVDFAYAIHTDIGNTCTGARINKRLAPLGTHLKTGEVVEVIRSKTAQPNPEWLKFAVTARARSNIRHYLKSLQATEAVVLGRRLLIRELSAFRFSLDDVTEDIWKIVLEDFKLENEDELFADIGLGNRLAPLVARKLIQATGVIEEEPRDSGRSTPLAIKGSEGLVINFPKCCNPIPGDPIIGFVTTGRGIVIHLQSCKNTIEFQNQPEKWVNVEWEEDIEQEFICPVSLDVTNQRGMLATIATTISDVEANIVNVEIKEKDDRYTRITFTIEVRDRDHLARVMRRIHGLKHVSHINRGY